jgi:hypothetical protein
MDESAIKGRMASLGFKRATGGGLTPEEQAELEQLQAELNRIKAKQGSGF